VSPPQLVLFFFSHHLSNTPPAFACLSPAVLLAVLKRRTTFTHALDWNVSIFHILKMALGFSSTQDFAAAARGKNP